MTCCTVDQMAHFLTGDCQDRIAPALILRAVALRLARVWKLMMFGLQRIGGEQVFDHELMLELRRLSKLNEHVVLQ